MCQGAREDTEDKALGAKLMFDWTGSFNVLAIGPTSAAASADDRLVPANLLFVELPSGCSGPASERRATVACCKQCRNPHDVSDMPKYLPVGLTQYVLNEQTATPAPLSRDGW